jgi:cyclic lactone autoinducer peptide
MLRKMLQLSLALLTFIAFTNIAAASCTVGYQPQLPEHLRDM